MAISKKNALLWGLVISTLTQMSLKATKMHTSCETHDYVIIGGGTAGLTLAYLLQRAHKDVVVIEAGRNVDNDAAILNALPLNQLEVQFRNEYFWTDDAKPLQNSSSTDVHAHHYSGGRVLGGTSSTNDTIWWRMQQNTYNEAGGLFADASYIDTCFKALETYTGTSQDLSKRGADGPLLTLQGPRLNGELSINPVAVKLGQAIQAVFQNAYGISIPKVDDYTLVSGSFVSDFGQFTVNPETLQRSSASNALLKGPTGQSLDIRLNAQLLNIEFCRRKAQAVTYIRNDKVCKISAKKKIILCTGHNTPAILQRNGIGDATHLASLDIDVVYDNPEVGKNLKNHISLVPILITINPADAAVLASYPLAFKRIGGAAAIPNPDNPNSAGRDYQLGIVLLGGNIGAIVPIFVNPESTGVVTIAEKNPLGPSITTLNYLSKQNDVDAMKKVVEIVQQIMIELHAIDSTYNLITNLSNPSQFVSANTSAFHHWHGQSLIGKVVDENLHVIGVEDLMIADLSVFPLTDGNTQSLAYTAGCAAYTILTGDKDIRFN